VISAKLKCRLGKNDVGKRVCFAGIRVGYLFGQAIGPLWTEQKIFFPKCRGKLLFCPESSILDSGK